MSKTRSDILNGAMLAPNEALICGHTVRRISVASLDLLCKVGCAFGNLEAVEAGAVKPTATDVARFLYIHCANRDEVVRTVLFEREKLDERVTAFCFDFSQEATKQAIDFINGEATAIQASKTKAVSTDKKFKSKNVRSLAT